MIFPRKVTYVFREKNTLVISSKNEKIFGWIKMHSRIAEKRRELLENIFMKVANWFFNLDTLGELADVIQYLDTYLQSASLETCKMFDTVIDKKKYRMVSENNVPKLKLGEVSFSFEIPQNVEDAYGLVRVFGKTIFYLSQLKDKTDHEIEKMEEYVKLRLNIRKFDVYVYRYLENK